MRLDQSEFEVSFGGSDLAEATRLANELEQDLRANGAQISRKKKEANSQDFGATLVIVLGTPVAIALAKSIGIFLQRHSGASITISKDGEVVATNLNSGDAARIVEAFSRK
jgi:hypothetical protein